MKTKELLIDLVVTAIVTYLICWELNDDFTWFKLLIGDGIKAEGVRGFTVLSYMYVLIIVRYFKQLYK